MLLFRSTTAVAALMVSSAAAQTYTSCNPLETSMHTPPSPNLSCPET